MTERKPIAAARPWFDESDIAEITSGIADVLRGGRLILGPRAQHVERVYGARLGVRHAVTLSSCTAALEIAFRHLRVAGREVIVPTNTFVATAAAVCAAGGTPVFADVDPADWCLDAEDAIARITDRTAAVVVVHIGGLIASGIDRLRDACRARGIALVEDCAHAHGARAGDREAGALGDVGCFSFYPTKVLTCAVGGMLATDDDDLAAFARSLRHHGQGSSLEEIVDIGNDWLLDEVRAVILDRALARLDDHLAVRRRIAARYDELLGDDLVTRPRPAAGTTPAWYKYAVIVPDGADVPTLRRRFREEHAIEVGNLYYPPVHLMPAWRKRLGTGPGMLPNAERYLPRQITLPMHAAMSLADADRAVAALRELLG